MSTSSLSVVTLHLFLMTYIIESTVYALFFGMLWGWASILVKYNKNTAFSNFRDGRFMYRLRCSGLSFWEGVLSLCVFWTSGYRNWNIIKGSDITHYYSHRFQVRFHMGGAQLTWERLSGPFPFNGVYIRSTFVFQNNGIGSLHYFPLTIWSVVEGTYDGVLQVGSTLWKS